MPPALLPGARVQEEVGFDGEQMPHGGSEPRGVPPVVCQCVPTGVVGDVERCEELVAGGPVGLQGADAPERDATGATEVLLVGAQVPPYVVLVEPCGTSGDVHELRVGRPVAEQ
ncbi:hypothetical protein [Streptomyces sp. NPDC001933]|uniref:hypothetical protein n=1 Tax=Streptomyces sp. NPDC001933 TaxID=3364626 RepID=UPI0036B3BD12